MNSVVAALERSYAEGRPLALLFDYDGTLAPLVDHPARAVLPEGTRSQLRRLSGIPGVRVGALSGRSLADLKEKVGLPGLDYAGTGGLEWEIEGKAAVHPSAPREASDLPETADALERVVADFPGAWVERKAYALTVHFRAIAGRDRDAFEHRVRRVLSPCGDRLKVVKATLAFEISPLLFWDKGSVIRLIQARMPPNPVLLYAGDSDGDADAFGVVRDLGGLTIGVGPEAPRPATDRVPDPSALAGLLESITLRGRRGT